MTAVTVTGYASLDYPVLLDGEIVPDRTARIVFRNPAAWPRLGGSPAYAGSAIVRAGGCALPVTWTGAGDEGERFVQLARAAGLQTDGIARLPLGRSPISLMIHQRNGSTTCLFDPGLGGQEFLAPDQKKIIADSRHLCVTVGPGHLAAEIMELCRADANIYWIAKNDPVAFPKDLRSELSRRSKVIFCNAAERDALNIESVGNAIVVETRGDRGVNVIQGKVCASVRSEPVEANDPTGAGDTFAGAFIASFIDDNDPVSAAQSGIAAARELLISRQQRGSANQ